MAEAVMSVDMVVGLCCGRVSCNDLCNSDVGGVLEVLVVV
jgi:hypothetical protein